MMMVQKLFLVNMIQNDLEPLNVLNAPHCLQMDVKAVKHMK